MDIADGPPAHRHDADSPIDGATVESASRARPELAGSSPCVFVVFWVVYLGSSAPGTAGPLEGSGIDRPADYDWTLET